MTATTNHGVSICGKQKPDVDEQPKADSKRFAEAKKRTAQYEKK